MVGYSLQQKPEAYVLFQLGLPDQAEPLFTESLRRQRAVMGDDHPETIRTMTNLGLVYVAQDRYAESDRLFLEALERQTELQGDAHPRTLLLLRRLADQYRKQARLDKAEHFLEIALATQRDILGDEHPDTLDTMERLADLAESRSATGLPREQESRHP